MEIVWVLVYVHARVQPAYVRATERASVCVCVEHCSRDSLEVTMRARRRTTKQVVMVTFLLRAFQVFL